MRQGNRPFSADFGAGRLEADHEIPKPNAMFSRFPYFNSLPEMIYRTAMMYIRRTPSRRRIEVLLFEPGLDLRHGAVLLRLNRSGPGFAAMIRKRRLRKLPMLSTSLACQELSYPTGFDPTERPSKAWASSRGNWRP